MVLDESEYFPEYNVYETNIYQQFLFTPFRDL